MSLSDGAIVGIAVMVTMAVLLFAVYVYWKFRAPSSFKPVVDMNKQNAVGEWLNTDPYIPL